METGIWTIHARITNKKLMLLQNILMSDDNRVVKQIIKQQIQSKEDRSWYSEVKETAEHFQINTEQCEEMNKSEWRNIYKDQNTERVREEKLKINVRK